MRGSKKPGGFEIIIVLWQLQDIGHLSFSGGAGEFNIPLSQLPVMIAPKWLKTKSQPIAIRNVLEYLSSVLFLEKTYGKSYDIGGPDVLTYKQMLHQFAEVRGLKRRIIIVPVMTPRLSSYWLYFVTSTSYKLAVNLVDSMKVEVIAADNELEQMLHIEPIPYKEAVRLAFQKIEQNNVISCWKDSLASSYADNSLLENILVPVNGVFTDKREKEIKGDPDEVFKNVLAVGGKKGWYYGNWMWKLRGFLDQVVGGVGLRKGRTNPDTVNTGDSLDFWRVLAADKQNKRLLLYAEMNYREKPGWSSGSLKKRTENITCSKQQPFDQGEYPAGHTGTQSCLFIFLSLTEWPKISLRYPTWSGENRILFKVRLLFVVRKCI